MNTTCETAEKFRSVRSSSEAQVLYYFDQEHWTQKLVLSDFKTHWTFLYSYDSSCTFLSCLWRVFSAHFLTGYISKSSCQSYDVKNVTDILAYLMKSEE